MKIEILNWDSEFFGYRIGKVELEEFHTEQYEDLIGLVKKSALKLVYIYPLDQPSKRTLLVNKVPLVATNVTFEKEDIYLIKNIPNTKSYNADDQYETVEKLALLSGQYSRYKRDSKFSNNEFSKLYTEWIKKSINKEIATDVIIYKITDKIKGFVSYKITSRNEIVIGLIAVDTSEQGQGIGKILMQSIENITFQNSIKKIIVSTQLDNIQAMALYYSCGYTLKKKQEIFHLWIP